jgi:hypothetical protein
LLTLYTTPVIYLYFDRLANRKSKKKHEVLEPRLQTVSGD